MSDIDLTPPNYRIRLFLSADLVGSTAYKASSESQGNALQSKWVQAFRDFYQDFPDSIKKSFMKAEAKDFEEGYNGPRIWKTIGDEILFSSRVTSVKQVAISIQSFFDAMDKQSKAFLSKRIPLDIKGSGWLAAFPHENISVSISDGNKISTHSNGYDLVTEDFEHMADEAPHKFDFLGKGIDAGFRISKNASSDRFTASIELALLLAQANTSNIFPARFSYHGREIFKGVIKGQPYPVVSIDTERNNSRRRVRDRERILTQERDVSALSLCDYLEAFIEHESIEMPVFSRDEEASISPPKSYGEYVSKWISVREEINRKNSSIENSEIPSNQIGSDTLDPVIRNFIESRRKNLDSEQ